MLLIPSGSIFSFLVLFIHTYIHTCSKTLELHAHTHTHTHTQMLLTGYIMRKQFAHVLQQVESARMSPADLQTCMDFFDVKGIYCMYMYVCMY